MRASFGGCVDRSLRCCEKGDFRAREQGVRNIYNLSTDAARFEWIIRSWMRENAGFMSLCCVKV